MFDVSWTDPTRETVGQRKNRRDQHSNGISRGSSVRSSESSGSRASKASDSNPAHSKPSVFNLFGTSKKPSLARNGSQSKLSALSSDQNARALRRISSYTTPPEPISPHTLAATKRMSINDHLTSGTSSNAETEMSSPSDESVFSGWTGRSHNTDSSWSSVGDPASAKGSIVQPLSQTSFVTQSTEITVSSRDSIDVPERLATIVRISAAGTMPIQIHDTASKLSPTLETFDFPVPKSQIPEPTPTPIFRDDIALSPEGWPVTAKGRQQDSWKPPDAWKCPEESVLPAPLMKYPDNLSRRSKNKRALPSTSELTHLQKNLRRMEAASPKIVVERLKEEWLEVADASVYRELELEKQLWMLSALRTLEKKHPPLEHTQVVKHSSNPVKILSLYENHASASFLSAHSPPVSTIHHLSPSPLSPASYPKIHPLTTPSPSASLPYASNLFNSIHSVYIPALLPAASLPAILKDCHRCLSTSGTLHLTLLDPSPSPSTLGPRLRDWLDTHLLINLERQFRCMNPSRLFPIWLTDAGLRAEGSTITIEHFLASVACHAATSPESSQGLVNGSILTGGEKEKQDEEIRQELKSQVGRLLWKEMWGGFVEGEKWWWEDDQVLEECERMGTGWEYAVITAVKEG